MIDISTSLDEVRLISEDGSQQGFVPLEEAQRRADSEGLDLVEVAAGVYKIMDQGKLMYAANKARKLSKQKQSKIKEVQFRLNIGEADYSVKMRKVVEFLSRGDKVKVILQLRGREQSQKEMIVSMLDRIKADSNGAGSDPSISGRNAVMVLENA